MEPESNLQEYATKQDAKELQENIQKLFTYMGTLHEEAMSKIGLLAEQVTRLATRQARAEQKIDILINTVADMKVELTFMSDKLDEKLDRTEFENRLRPLEAQL